VGASLFGPSCSVRRRVSLAVTLPALSLVSLPMVGVSAVESQSPPVRSAVATVAEVRPNIVVLMADDMREDDLIFMPNTRRILLRNGLHFRNSFAPNPLCCPSRASFLTGRYSHNHRVMSQEAPWGFRAFDDSFTISTALKRSGYRTALVGKYLNGYGHQLSKVTGRPSLHYVPAGYTDWYASLEPPRGSPVLGDTYNYLRVAYNHNGLIEDNHQGEYSTNGIGRISRRLIEKYAQGSAPFFVYSSFVAPHAGGPPEADDPVWDLPAWMYAAYVTPARPTWVRGRFNTLVTRAPGLPRGGGPVEWNISDKPGFLRRVREPGPRIRRAVLNVTRQRAESLYVLDQEVGRTVRTLKRTGEWSHTVLVFTSDNGFFLGEHRRMTGKILAHEPSLRVPLLVTGPGMRQRENRDDPITTVDLAATILDLGNATGRMRRHHLLDGHSLLPTMLRGDRGWNMPVVTESHLPGAPTPATAGENGFTRGRTYIGLRTAQYAYVRYIGGATELYDLAVDANQMRSRQADPAYRPVKRMFRDLWDQYRNCIGAKCQVALPEELRADPARLRQLTRSFWSQVNQIHGY
jgi:N-acetylglucosamine-6-sulfatase